jgi:hypothetical protein
VQVIEIMAGTRLGTILLYHSGEQAMQMLFFYYFVSTCLVALSLLKDLTVTIGYTY